MPVWIPGQGRTFGYHRRDFSRAVAAGLSYRPLPLTAADTLAWFRTLPYAECYVRTWPRRWVTAGTSGHGAA